MTEEEYAEQLDRVEDLLLTWNRDEINAFDLALVILDGLP